MAKKSKNSVDMDVNVKGKGVKKTTLQMKQLGDQTQKVSKSTAEANRNWKGASNQSSGASKNFSKMSQGMGGIVGAYATLAANIFAIGAAFRFLESAGDLQKLKEGQVLYASATGVALKSLTNDIIAATDAQITFANASQSAAIGKAAGLTNDQLTRLGKGAKDASIILGRDVTDSFNRLIRGVTKAEPELLDELGIILRLNDATEKYAATIGKSAQDLTQFEKSQAVTVEVLDQVESKYGRIMAVMEPSGNQFTQLGKAFDDIVNHIKEFAAAIATPIAGVLTEQPLLIAGILLALGNTLINTGLTQWTQNASDAADVYGKKLDEAKAKLVALQAQGEKRAKGSAQAALNLQAAAQKQGAIPAGFKAKSWQMAAAGEGEKLTSQQLVGMKASVTAHKKMHKDIKASWILALDEMLTKSKATTAQTDLEFKKTATWFQVQTARMKVAWAGTMSFIKTAAAATGKFITKAFSILSWVSILYTMGKAAFDWFKGVRDGGEAIEETITPMDIATQKVIELNEEFEKFNAVQRIITEDGHGFLQFFEAMGNKIGSLTSGMQKAILQDAGEAFSEFINQTEAEWAVLQDDLAVGDTDLAGGLFGKNLEEVEAKLGSLREDLIELQTLGAPSEEYHRQIGRNRDAYNYPGAVIPREGPETEHSIRAIREAEEELENYENRLGTLRLAQQAMNNDLIAFMEFSPDEGHNAFAEFFNGMVESAELAASAFNDKANNPVTAYLEELEKLRDVDKNIVGTKNWDDLLKSIFAAQAAAQAYSATITEVTRLQTENQQEAAKLLTDTQKRSTEGRMVDSLQRELELRLELNRAGFDAPEGMSEEEKQAYRDRGNRLQQELNLFKLIDEMKAEDQKRVKAQTAMERRLLTGQTKLVASRLKLEMSLMKNEDKRLKIQNEIDAVTQKIALNNGIMEPQQRDMLELSMLELANLEAQNDELERKLDLTKQLGDAAKQSLESGLTKGIAAMLKGEEKSFKDMMLGLATSVMESVVDTFSKQMSEGIMTLLFGPEEDEATKMKNALIEGADYWVDVVGRTIKPDDTYYGDPVAKSLQDQQPKDFFNIAGLMNPSFKYGTGGTSAKPWSMISHLDDDQLGATGVPSSSANRGFVDVYNSCVDINNSILDLTTLFTGPQGANVNTLTERGRGSPSADEIFNTPGFGVNPRNSRGPIDFSGKDKIDSILNSGGRDFGIDDTGTNSQYAPEINPYRIGSDPFNVEGMLQDMRESLKRGENPNSFYVHDTHVERALLQMGATGFTSQGDLTGLGTPGTSEKADPTNAEKLGSMFGKDTAKFAGEKKGGFMDKLTGFFSADSPWMTKLGDFFSGDSEFLSGLSGLFGGLGDIFGQIFGGGMGGGGWMSLLSLFGMANGGIVKGGFRKYAHGGIATSPTLGMVGEGKYNEAIVPLPNGKSIPVDMRSSAQTNNVTVNVSSDGQTQVEGGQDNEGLGRAIAFAVQEELQNQKRAGGILNKYGTA